MTQRIYSFKDTDMLMACKTIIRSMSANQSDLSMVRTNWDETYITDLDGRIDSTITDFLGLDKKKELRDATENLKNILEPALKNLSFFKTQIEVDFGKRAKEILKSLGFTKPLKGLDQESLIQLLNAFNKGMTNNLKNEIVAKGTNPVLIETILGHSANLQQANLEQEGLKSSTQEVSEEAVSIFNNIYAEVIGICKIASKMYQDDPIKKDQFTFSKVIQRMGSGVKKESIPVEE